MQATDGLFLNNDNTHINGINIFIAAVCVYRFNGVTRLQYKNEISIFNFRFIFISIYLFISYFHFLNLHFSMCNRSNERKI